MVFARVASQRSLEAAGALHGLRKLHDAPRRAEGALLRFWRQRERLDHIVQEGNDFPRAFSGIKLAMVGQQSGVERLLDGVVAGPDAQESGFIELPAQGCGMHVVPKASLQAFVRAPRDAKLDPAMREFEEVEQHHA